MATQPLTAEQLTKNDRSFLLYVETCCVDGGGLLVSERMNAEDHASVARLEAGGLMCFGRIPAALLDMRPSSPDPVPTRPRGVTHYAALTDAGWALAHQLRRERSKRKGPFASAVFEHERTLQRHPQLAA